MNLQDNTQVSAIADDSYLELQIDPKTIALLAMVNIREVVNVAAASIVPVPNMPASVLGLFNHQSQVYWVFDLGQLVGLAPLDVSIPKYAVVILAIDQTVLAIALPMIRGIQHFNKLSRDQSPNPGITTNISQNLPKSLLPYVEGYGGDALIPVLNPRALLKAI